MASRSDSKRAMTERILDVADRLFYHQGIRAVGVDAIAAEIGISKRTLYNYFPTKDALIAAYLQRRMVPFKQSDKPPIEQILWFFDRLERTAGDDDFRGCPFVNAVSEIAEPKHPARKLAQRFKEDRRLWLRERLAEAGVLSPDALATQLQLLSEGAIAAVLVRGDARMVRVAKQGAITLLKAAGVQGVG
ncbi:MAG TPA: helix-turn-helix domain-containing protein [bacterium]